MGNATKAYSFVIILTLALFGCNKHDINSFLDNIDPEKNATSRSTGETQNTDGANLPISNTLPPFDDTIPLKKQYPRVAVTIVKSPANHNEFVSVPDLTGADARPFNAQYILKARIWSDEHNFRDTEEFTFDLRKDSPKNIPLDVFRNWNNIYTICTDSTQSTGLRRTNGPIPPDKPFPNDMRHIKFTNDQNRNSPDNILMLSLACIAGVEPRAHDRRFWIVEFLDAK